ncbi:MAG TPA: response regulator [Vicinamibacterales bacterium]|nr:response regulator [Vicinamibacterales bacterium]
MTGSPLRILIVDDSREDREFYRRLLRQDRERQYEFLEAETAEQGLQACESGAVDCVLLDYRLPDLDGLVFLRQLQQRCRQSPLPVILLTGQGSEQVAVDAMKSGAQDYLLKTAITADSLARAIQYAIDRVELLRSIERRTRELSEANAELQKEVAQRKRAEAALQRMNDELERLVHERTAELSRANQELSVEIAERRRIEEERALLLQREQQANRLKDEFLATVSHELRTPLNAILGWARVLRTANLTAALQSRALESIERNALAQARLIEDILEVSRIVTGKLRLRVGPLDLVQVVDAAIDVIRPAADAKEIRLEYDRPREPWKAVGDFDRLQQIVWNLLSNAVKFTPRHGLVRVILRRADGWDQLIVEDSGKGIDPAFLPHVFAPFRQGDASTTRDHGGLGLGLAIVKQLVELHGGSVRAESEGPGKGSRFTVMLPVPAHRAEAPVEAAERVAARLNDAAAGAPVLTGVRVLVVDDDVDSRELIAATLGHYGAIVVEAGSAAEAMERLREDKPDVLLSDIGMQGEDGYAFIRRVRALPRQDGGLVPAVAVTAYAAAGDRANALSAGFQLHVSKPFDPVALARTVERLARSTVRG